jgi:hypothetical protein
VRRGHVRHARELPPPGPDQRRPREHRLERVARDVLEDGRRSAVERLREQIHCLLVTVCFVGHDLSIPIAVDEQPREPPRAVRVGSAPEENLERGEDEARADARLRLEKLPHEGA